MLHTRVFILRGLSGSGKSTFAEKFLRPLFHHFEVVSADRFFTNERGEYAFDLDMLSAAHEQCYRNFEFHLKFMNEHAFNESYYNDQPRRSALIVDNTNLEPYEIAPYWMKASVLGMSPEILTFNGLGSVDDHVLRNLHGLDHQKIENQQRKFQRAEIPFHWKRSHFTVHHTSTAFKYRFTRENEKGEQIEFKNLLYPFSEDVPAL